MNLYPWSVLFGDASLLGKCLAWLTIVFGLLLVLWAFSRQNGNNRTRAINEPASKMVKMANLRNSKRGSPDTVATPLKRAASISVVTYPESKNEATALASRDTPRNTVGSVSDSPVSVNHNTLEGRGVNTK